MRNLTKSEKSSRTRRRNKNPLRAAKKVAERPQPADGIKRRKSKVTGEWQEFCLTPEATKRRRDEVWLQASGYCQGEFHKGHFFYLGNPESSSWEWHHKVFKSQGGDDSLNNALALCPECHVTKHGVRAVRTGRFEI